MGLSTSTTICNILFLSIGFLWCCNGDNNNNNDGSSVHVHVKAKNIRRRTRYIPRAIVADLSSNYVDMLPLSLQQQDNDNDIPELLETDVRNILFSMDTSLPEPTSMPNKEEKPTPEEPPTREDRDLLIQTKCDTTAIERSRDILSELLTVSTSSSLINPETSQFKARDWLDNFDSAIICPGESERIHQRYRLALLYYQFGGDQWTRCSSAEKFSSSLLSLPVSSKTDDDDDDESESEEEEECPGNPWLGAGNECQWYGMSCSGDDALSNDDDDGEYRPLEVLNLQSNNLSGELFDELYGLQSLQKLLLDGNDQITGTISEEVGNLINLTVLQLQSNLIDGPIPEEGLLQLEQLGTLYKIIFK
jgi:hypothetical protein